MESLHSIPVLQSCAMCIGGATGEIANAANGAIGLMLIFLVLVLGSFGGFIFYLVRRARMVAIEDGMLEHELTRGHG